MQSSQYNKYEQLIYLGAWITAFLAPMLTMWTYSQLTPETFEWRWVTPIWEALTWFMIAFAVHNYAIAPLLIYHRNWKAYTLAVLCLVTVFFACQDQMPHKPRPRKPHRIEMRTQAARQAVHARPGDMMPPPGDNEPPFDSHDMVMTTTLLLLMGVNLGVKAMFKAASDRKRLEKLQKENMAQELEYLKYQISPHFFMNTLNNIHALVDINPERAKSTIVELSKMMRYLLYDGAKEQIPLKVETTFITNYVKLMRLRYPDTVSISLDVPQNAPDRTVPPLLLITFVENAFKHGVSYQRPSFISIAISTDGGTMRFYCSNSKAPAASGKQQGGVGLVNAKKRLNLIYGNGYTLNIDDGADTFTVNLVIPIKPQGGSGQETEKTE